MTTRTSEDVAGNSGGGVVKDWNEGDGRGLDVEVATPPPDAPRHGDDDSQDGIACGDGSGLLAVGRQEGSLEAQFAESRRELEALKAELATRRGAEDRLVSRMRDLEKRVAARADEQRQANQDLASLGMFASVMLQGPLRQMDGYIRAAVCEPGATSMPPKIRQFLEQALAQAEAQNQMIGALIDFANAGRQPVALEPVDMTSVFRAAADALEEQSAACGCLVHVEDLPSCDGDNSLLRLVAHHLLSNAIRFSASSQSPVVDVTSWREEGNGRGKGGEVAYAVRDNGSGFPAAFGHRLFAPITAAWGRGKDASSRCAGLGLATTRRCVNRLGGRIWAESKEGHGATFAFTVGKADRASKRT